MTDEKKDVVAKRAANKMPPEPVKNLQQDLFSHFHGEENDLSNTVFYWDRIPKYFLNSQKQKALRTAEGLASTQEYTYNTEDTINGRTIIKQYRIEIQPALLKQKDGTFKAFFPRRREEKIEEILRKIFKETFARSVLITTAHLVMIKK